MTTRYQKLDTAGWAALGKLIGKNQSNPLITPLTLDHLRRLRAGCMLVETDYLNRDFTEAYAAYYARTFRRHSKLCIRISFFQGTLDFFDAGHSASDAADLLEKAGSSQFLGYIVLRPVTEAPVSEIVLRTPEPKTADTESYPLVAAPFKIHVAGAELQLKCVPMTQQDTRIGACAQAAIWSITRFFHAKHNGPWLTTCDITRMALNAAEFLNSFHVPAGSEFLTLGNMAAALRAAGREPLLYMEEAKWNGVRPLDAINRYVDSGIPVLVGLCKPKADVGHAVVAVGQVLRKTPRGPLPAYPTRAEFLEGLYVNDDQHGQNVVMPIDNNSPEKESDWNLLDVKYIIVPLPAKVYLSAEKAEIAAWNEIREYCQIIYPQMISNTNVKLNNSSINLGKDLVEAFNTNNLVARTYLTFGWKYKHRALRNQHPEAFKTLVRATDLPRFVYVTEFSSLQMLENKTLTERRVVSHCVIDTTAKNTGKEAVMIFHAPGFVRRRALDGRGDLVPSVSFLADDNTYCPKLRGEKGFIKFKADPPTP